MSLNSLAEKIIGPILEGTIDLAKELARIVKAISAIFITLMILYPWIPKTVTVVVIITVGYWVAIFTNEMRLDFSAFVAFTSLIVAVIILTFNLAHWTVNGIFWVAMLPFQII